MPIDPSIGPFQAKQLPGRVKPHPSEDNWIKAFLSKALRIRAWPFPIMIIPSGSLNKPSQFSIREAETRKKQEEAHTLTEAKQNHIRKKIMMIKLKVMSQFKGKLKKKEVDYKQTSRK